MLTYIHFDVDGPVVDVPQSYREVQETVEFEHLLARYVRLFLSDVYGRDEESRLILKQLMIHLLRADTEEPVERRLVTSYPM